MIIDNLVPEENYNRLITFITALDFPWYYQPNIAYIHDPNHKNENLIKSFGLTHTVWDIEKGKVSEALSYVEPILDSFQKHSNIKINNFIRIKINLQTPVPGNDINKYNGAHVDRYTDHNVLIYYPLDSDGDTFVFNEIFNPNNDSTHPMNVIPTIKEKITPKANRLYMLDTGLRYHSSSNPITFGQRFSININFT
jgi:hypothetical protein